MAQMLRQEDEKAWHSTVLSVKIDKNANNSMYNDIIEKTVKTCREYGKTKQGPAAAVIDAVSFFERFQMKDLNDNMERIKQTAKQTKMRAINNVNAHNNVVRYLRIGTNVYRLSLKQRNRTDDKRSNIKIRSISLPRERRK